MSGSAGFSVPLTNGRCLDCFSDHRKLRPYRVPELSHALISTDLGPLCTRPDRERQLSV